ncbi:MULTISPECIES: DUF3046 domain-containing protein [Microbacterium]|jgi:hypothetical protein|uniref:DUF3046 domain-containing protein n=1 Tax=Microbacterium TaxID=33882 RepID=UPI001D1732C5|nr:DUF3046 domain-containing protein [Microbacterium testaceum]MCC4249052.1 DUF3046 domain-containing protein [Microbacterium testaceum]
MRRSEFDRAVADEFGARGSSLMTDLVLSSVGGRTSADALAAGVDPREVWLALCDETDVPAERRYGVGRLDPRRR